MAVPQHILILISATSIIMRVTSAPVGPPKIHLTSENKLRDVNWFSYAEKTLKDKQTTTQIVGQAKNIILFIGDGLGVSTVTAARVLKAQQENKSLHETRLSWEGFPYTSMSITYAIDQMTPDSASTGTAYLCGAKTNAGLIGVDQRVRRGKCETLSDDNKLKSILEYANDAGKWTGFVTNTRVTHATPAATYAKSPERDWEADSDINEANSECVDIARQLVEDNHYIKVAMGGGRKNFFGKNEPDPENTTLTGVRTDGINLMKMWVEKQTKKPKVGSEKVKVVFDQSGFDAIDPEKTEYVLGLFEQSHMLYELERTNEPSLPEMVEKAIKILQKGEDGFFLLVEGGMIDRAHHANKAYKALTETLSLSEAVQKAVDLTNKKDTLIIATADHSHVFTLAGYTHPDSDILGVSRRVVTGEGDVTDVQLAKDGLPWLPLSYANGPGYIYHRTNGSVGLPVAVRRNLLEDEKTGATRGVNYVQDSAYPLSSETHGGEDVTVHAIGPMSHLFHGTHEQNYIAHVMLHAFCVGPYKDQCTTSGARDKKHGPLIFIALILSLVQCFKVL